jgi:hypothetical protein
LEPGNTSLAAWCSWLATYEFPGLIVAEPGATKRFELPFCFETIADLKYRR